MHIVADDRSEQLVVLCNKSTFALLLQIVNRIDQEVEGEGEIHVVALQNAKAKDMVQTLTKVSRSKQGRGKQKGTAVFEGDVQISENEATNSLVIVSSYRDFRNLRKVIRKLDVRRKQVYVEAAILEVKVDDNLEYGLNFASGGFTQKIGDERVPIFFGKSFANATPGLMAGMLGSTLEGTEKVPGLGAIGGVPSLGVMLNAMRTDSNINVRSTPHITTTDNEEAEIVVGDTIPFPSGNIINNASGSQITYKREDVALKLKIKPQVNENGYMTLEVSQEVTELGPMTEFGFTTSKRSAKTTINAEDEQTVVIGGLMKDIETETENKVPVLGDIPILGNLFKYTKKSKQKVNLLIILTPHIIVTKGDFARIHERKMRERKEFAKKFYGKLRDYESAVMIEKKRGFLLSVARKLDDRKQELEEEIDRKNRSKKKRALMIDPDGKETEVEIDKDGKTNLEELDEEEDTLQESVPVLEGDDE